MTMTRIFKIMNKELVRVLKNRRMFLSLLLPGILIFIIYSFTGDFVAKQEESALNKAYTETYAVYVVGEIPDEVLSIIDALQFDFDATTINASEIDSVSEMVMSGDVDLLLEFGGVWEVSYLETNLTELPTIKALYNPKISKSAFAYQEILMPSLMQFSSMVLEARNITVDVFDVTVAEIFDEKKEQADINSLLVPMFIMIFLFSGCLAVVPESIAGEKERGTMASLLASPVRRSEIAIGKITALSILALISGASSFLGLILSLPKMMGTGSLFSIYSVGEIALLFLIVVSTVLVIVSLMTLLSSYSRNVKEATMLLTPLMILGVVVGMLNLFLNTTSGLLFFLIPLFNTSASLASILTFEMSIMALVVTIVSNIIYMAICVWALAKLFDSEKVMFSK